MSVAAETGAFWRIAIVEDNDILRERLARALRDRGHMVVCAGTRASASAIFRSVELDGAVIDVHLAGDSGLDVAAELLLVQPGVRVVIVTGLLTDTLKAEAKHPHVSSHQSQNDGSLQTTRWDRYYR